MAAGSGAGFAKLPAGVKALLGILIIGVVSAVYYFALHMRLTDEIDSEIGRHAQLARQYRDAEARQREYLQLTQEFAGREALDRQNRRVLPEAAEIPAFLQDLNRLAELSGLVI